MFTIEFSLAGAIKQLDDKFGTANNSSIMLDSDEHLGLTRYVSMTVDLLGGGGSLSRSSAADKPSFSRPHHGSSFPWH
jgi:hypothetical protein